jgi:O-antigen/teichoic acid export membrane protein
MKKMHKLTKDILTLFTFSAFAGIASFFFSFAMLRMLSIEEYSLLYAITSLLYILTIPQETIRTVISRYVAKYNTFKEKGKIAGLMKFATKRVWIFSIICFLIFLAISPLLVKLLHANFLFLAVTGSNLLLAFLLPVMWGFFQGFGKFKELGINNSVESVSKVIFAILFVIILPLNIRLYGVIFAGPISMVMAFLLAFVSLKHIKKEKAKKVKENLTKYSLATLIIFGLVTLMYSVDVLIARYFFTEKISGIYNSIALLSKFLFFIAVGAKRAMMPNLVEKKEKKNEKEVMKILKRISLILFILFAVFFIMSILFPKQIVFLVLGSKYELAIPHLKYMVAAMAFFSFANLLVYYNLSLDQNKKMTIRILASSAFLEIILLCFFHKTLRQFIWMFLIVNIILLIAMAIITLIKPKPELTIEE